jgi:hypothetical protein
MINILAYLLKAKTLKPAERAAAMEQNDSNT